MADLCYRFGYNDPNLQSGDQSATSPAFAPWSHSRCAGAVAESRHFLPRRLSPPSIREPGPRTPPGRFLIMLEAGRDQHGKACGLLGGFFLPQKE